MIDSVGSHAPTLVRALSILEYGAMVVEHGAGLYSTPLIREAMRDYDRISVVCIEAVKMWGAWAGWMYGESGQVLTHAKQVLPHLPNAKIVFIDGTASERGDLLRWSIDARVPCIIAHDTEDDHRKQYGYARELFSAPGYEVAHDGTRPRTTVWHLR